ncbi:MAG: hypothetical protein GQ525_11245, partial [Draconibacterium sp.]|nr:hypothetical protein [Draconibacterium sp.]
MQNNILRNFIIFIFILSIFSSCNLFNDDTENSQTEQYLVSSEKVATYLPAIITSILEQVGANYPEIEPIIAEVEHGVTVYKISYITTFNGDDVIASGLVSIPTSMGVYP